MKGVEFLSWGKYRYYDVQCLLDEANKDRLILLVSDLSKERGRERGRERKERERKEIVVDNLNWRFHVVNFTWSKYIFLGVLFSVLCLCWGNFFFQVYDLWQGRMDLSFNIFLNFLVSACGIIFAVILFYFWLPFLRFSGFFIINSRVRFDEQGKKKKGYVIALERKEELYKVNEIVMLFNRKKEEKEEREKEGKEEKEEGKEKKEGKEGKEKEKNKIRKGEGKK